MTSRPELCISVRSEEPTWGITAAFVAERMRGGCPFSYGDLIDFGHEVTPGCGLTSFLVYWPNVLDEEGYAHIGAGDG